MAPRLRPRGSPDAPGPPPQEHLAVLGFDVCSELLCCSHVVGCLGRFFACVLLFFVDGCRLFVVFTCSDMLFGKFLFVLFGFGVLCVVLCLFCSSFFASTC